jgi:hypothetical protein
MQVQLLVERGQNECIVRLAGTAYIFKRNEYGHLVSDFTDHDDIKWVSHPHHDTAFKLYSVPQKNILDEMVDEAVPVADSPKAVPETSESRMSAHFGNEMPVHEQVGKNAFAPHTGQVDESSAPAAEKPRPPYPKKGSKRPPKRRKS